MYGIVKQSDGYIHVSSAVGHGTTFEIYLPVVQQELLTEEDPADEAGQPGGTETILLAEDEAPVRLLIRYILEDRGYTVLEASNAGEALQLAAEHQGTVDLLITDVVMPKMSGVQLVEVLRSRHPRLRVLYRSGYAEDAVFRHGFIGSEPAFLQKPFTNNALTLKVREVLDQPE